MSEEKKGIRKTTVQIQEGFVTPKTPLIRGIFKMPNNQESIDKGFVPQNSPSKPSGKEDKGFVPPSSPRKPPDKPPAGKK